MAQPYVGEIRLFGGNFAPVGWAFCDGATLAIADNDVLFQLIGTTYGGDGQTTFNVPDLRGRAPVHQGTNYTMGQVAGAETVTLTVQHLPAHNHALLASTGAGGTANAQGNVPAASPSVQLYIQDVPSTPIAANAVTPAGGSQPHENRMPFLVVNYIISLFGIFPSPT
jgi:microcystin-dependent protein